MTKESHERAGHRGMIERLAERAALAVHDLVERQRLARELEALDRDGLLDPMLAEVGLSHGELEPMRANHPESSRLLTQMAERLRITAQLHADPATERDMWRLCTVCESQGRCKHWLASGATEGYQDFCPNAERLEAMRQGDL